MLLKVFGRYVTIVVSEILFGGIHISVIISTGFSHYSLGVIIPNKFPLTIIRNIFSKTLQKQNFKPLGHYTCTQCGTSHLQTVQETILSRIILATYRKFTVATVRFTHNVSCNIYTHPRYEQVANVTV